MSTPKFIRLTFKGIEEVKKEIEAFPRKCTEALHRPRFLKRVGTVLVASAVKTLNMGGRPAYKPLAESTKAAKLRKYKKESHILVAGGQLRQSLDYDVQNGRLFLTSIEYLKYHQFTTGRTKAKFPARPVWGVQDEDQADINAFLLEELKK